MIKRNAIAGALLPLPTRPYPEEFFRTVADIYVGLFAAGSHRPAAIIAAETKVPPSTAHRWIRVARQRGLLGAATGTRAGYAGAESRPCLPAGYENSGLAYCRVHHGVVECDEGGLCCDMADGVDVRSHRRPSAEDEGCDLTSLLYRAGDDGS